MDLLLYVGSRLWRLLENCWCRLLDDGYKKPKMGTFTETANVDYRLRFANAGKQNSVFYFHLQQTNRSCHLLYINSYIYMYIFTYTYTYIYMNLYYKHWEYNIHPSCHPRLGPTSRGGGGGDRVRIKPGINRNIYTYTYKNIFAYTYIQYICCRFKQKTET